MAHSIFMFSIRWHLFIACVVHGKICAIDSRKSTIMQADEGETKRKCALDLFILWPPFLQNYRQTDFESKEILCNVTYGVNDSVKWVYICNVPAFENSSYTKTWDVRVMHLANGVRAGYPTSKLNVYIVVWNGRTCHSAKKLQWRCLSCANSQRRHGFQ